MRLTIDLNYELTHDDLGASLSEELDIVVRDEVKKAIRGIVQEVTRDQKAKLKDRIYSMVKGSLTGDELLETLKAVTQEKGFIPD